MLDQLGISGLLVPPIRPVAAGLSLSGPAFTVKCSVGGLGSFAPSEFSIEMYVDKAASGDVIAIDAGGACVSTMGGIAATVAQMRGISIIVSKKTFALVAKAAIIEFERSYVVAPEREVEIIKQVR